MAKPLDNSPELKTGNGYSKTEESVMKPNSKLHYHVARLLGICGFVLGSITVAQANITVTSLGDSGPGSLRQAIADAAPGEIVDFATTGTITLTSGELVVGKDLTISGPGAMNLIVSGNDASRVFNISSATTASVSDLTIANGYGVDFGGGVFNSGTLTISDCVITSNTNNGPWGGGIFNSGALVISNSTVSMNCAGPYYSGSWGGGIGNDGTMTAVNSIISSNYAGSAGGGIGNYNGSVRVLGGAVLENRAVYGGGIYNYGYSLITLTNTTISRNLGTWGGGFYSDGSTSDVIISSTICSNRAFNYGGINTVGQMIIGNSIVAGNLADGFGGISDCSGTVNSLDYNLIQNTTGATITGVTTHNIYGKDPKLGPLADNSGPTLTHALLPGSPAIDHGSSGGLTTDQRGLPRPFNFPAYFDADDGSDIGAYELQERAQTGPVFTVNSNDDTDDGIPGIAHCSLREAIAAANAFADTNTIDFAAEVPRLHTGVTGTITLTNGELVITNDLTITGPGATNLTVSGNNSSRVFRLTSAQNVNIGGLTITRGNSAGGGGNDGGGGIFSWGPNLLVRYCTVSGNYSSMSGGGIYCLGGAMTVLESTISSNSAQYGGGIRTWSATANLTGCSVVNNSARAMSAGGIEGNSYIALTNCTVSGNGGWYGGGLWIQGTAAIVNSTICSNSAVQGGGIYQFSSGAVALLNSIVAGNSATTGPDCNGGFNSLDFNLIQNTNGCTITNFTAHNLYNQDPKLGPLADLGGPTPTHALWFDSPAIDAGHSSGLTTDQRGLPRPIDSPDIANADSGDGSDIGAYEADPNLRIMAIEKVGSDIRLRFNTVLGRTYQVESEDNLDNSWTVLTTNIIGDGSSVQAIDAGAANLPKRFYRAVLPLP
jgi:CSLREA domain-containing protein